MSILTGFVLIDAETQEQVSHLAPGMKVTLDTGKEYAIRADTTAKVGSVRLILSGPVTHTQTENVAPYSLYGDRNNRLHGKPLPAGEYALQAKAYAEKRARGTAVDIRHVTFVVTGQSAAQQPNPQEEADVPASSEEKRILEEHIEFNGIADSDRDIIALLKKALSLGGGYATAARAIATERGLSIEPKSRPHPDQPIPYDANEHILLCDEAHKSHLYKEEEYQEFVRQVKAAGLTVFKVVCPKWPPVQRTPLVLTMSTSGGAAGGPFDEKPWTGIRWAVEYGQRNRTTVQRIRNAILPVDRRDDHDRVAYRWQVPCFNPARHVRLRKWVAVNGLDLPEFFDVCREKGLRDTWIQTVNPYALEEKRAGSFTEDCRSVLRTELPRLEQAFLGGRPSRIPPVPAWPGWDYKAHENDEGAIPSMPKTQEAEVYDMPPEATETPPQNMDFLEKGARVYDHWTVTQALKKTLPNVRFFSGRSVDDALIGITPEALGLFLQRDKTNKMTYVRTIEGRGFDCDDFAVLLRAGMSRQGVHSVGIIAGDKHAWNVVILADGDEPSFAFVEPQTDGEVTALTGQYSVERRCEVYL